MKSPFTGGDAALCHEKQSFEFRKDNFEIVYHFYRCKDTNEEFTTTELDQLNMNQVYNLYRQKYAIPFPDEIKRVRELYGISALRMSKLLGFGDNQYRKYEEGEMPSVSNGKMISALKDPHFFLEILKLAQNQFPNDEILKIEKRVKELLLNNSCFENKINEFIFHNRLSLRSSMNGYASVIPEKVKQIIVFFASALQGVFETKLNKLLFYSDFLSYKKYGKGISGLQYQAISYGPVPVRYSTIYENLDGLKKEIINLGNGYSGSIITTVEQFEQSLFTVEELEVLKCVLVHFEKSKANEISEMSHAEEAWRQNEKQHSLIDYSYAFDLRQV